MIGSSKITDRIIPENAFEHKKKKPGLSANRPSNNLALNVKCLKGNLGHDCSVLFHSHFYHHTRQNYSILGLIQLFVLHFCTGNRYLDIEVLSSKENVTVTLNGQLV